MTPAKHAWMIFREFSRERGYIEKVSGDDAYTKHRTPHSPMIKLLSAKNGRIQVFETGKGRYEVPLT